MCMAKIMFLFSSKHTGKPIIRCLYLKVTKGIREGGYVEINAAANEALQEKQIVLKGTFSLLSHLQNGGSAEGEHEL